jgi:hypothetical protein
LKTGVSIFPFSLQKIGCSSILIKTWLPVMQQVSQRIRRNISVGGSNERVNARNFFHLETTQQKAHLDSIEEVRSKLVRGFQDFTFKVVVG